MRRFGHRHPLASFLLLLALIEAVVVSAIGLPLYYYSYNDHTRHDAQGINALTGPDFTVWWLGPRYQGQRANAYIDVKSHHRVTDTFVATQYGHAATVDTHPAKDFHHGADITTKGYAKGYGWSFAYQTRLGPAYYAAGYLWSKGGETPAQLTINLKSGEYVTLFAPYGQIDLKPEGFRPLVRALRPTRPGA